jgi:UDP-N-acetylmuramoyl-tripeptide--D-alanyl-D-alanine ligase
MRGWEVEHIAEAAGAEIVRGAAAATEHPGPARASIDSRRIEAGELFVGLRGENLDGGSHAGEALAKGAWGVLATPEHARAAAQATGRAGAILAHPDPLAGMQALARAWRTELGDQGAQVVAITGSTGKTSTKDILAALLSAGMRVSASPENLNTEIGMPLALLATPSGVEAVVLEMAMRGSGQIAELTAIARPDVGVIVNVGPAHLELLGSLEAIAAAKAELIAGMAPGTSVVVPAGERLLAPHVREDLNVTTFGEQGDVRLLERRLDGSVVIGHGREEMHLRPSFTQAHNLRNLLAAVAGARAVGYTPAGAVEVRFSSMRGQRVELGEGVVLINDCYNANPMSMRAAIEDLGDTAPGRRVAVLGDMLELGAGSDGLHREIGAAAAQAGVEVLLAVGPLAQAMRATFTGDSHGAPDARAAAELLAGVIEPGDTVLVKGSRGVGLEVVADALTAGRGRS